MRLKNISTSLLVTTLAKELLMSATNITIAIFLARQFQPTLFINYVSLIFIVSAFAQINREIQRSTVRHVLNGSLSLIHSRFDLKPIIALEILIWIAFSPIVSRITSLSMFAVIAAGFCIPATVLSSHVSGILQSSEKFRTWQTWLTLTTLIQIPLVLLGVLFGAGLTYYVLTAFLPMYLSSMIYLSKSRPVARITIPLRTVDLFAKGLFFVFFFLNYNILFLILKIVIYDDLGKFSLITYPLGVLVGVSSIFGSFRLPKEFKASSSTGITKRNDLMTYLLILAAMIIVSIAIKFASSDLIPKVLGQNYQSDISTAEAFIPAFAYSFWGLAYWIVQSRAHNINRRTTQFQAVLLILETNILIFAETSILSLFFLHGLFGATLVLMIYSSFSSYRDLG